MSEKPDLYTIIFKMSEDMGAVKTSIKGIEDKFNNLPCSAQEKKLNDIESFKDNLTGKMTILGVIGGIIGTALITALNWFLGKS